MAVDRYAECEWFDVTLQVVCYEPATVEVYDDLHIRIGTLVLCAAHARRARKNGYEEKKENE